MPGDTSSRKGNQAGQDETDAIIRHEKTRSRYKEAHTDLMKELHHLIRPENQETEQEAEFSGELQNTFFLYQGFEICRFVGKIILQRGNTVYGTGVMVSQRLLLTSLHTFRDGKKGVVRFGEIESVNPSFQPTVATFDLEPETLFFSDSFLDVAIIAVAERSREGHPLANIGFCQDIDRDVKAGEHINIIQYPKGGYQKMTLRQNQVLHQDDTYVKFPEKRFKEHVHNDIAKKQYHGILLKRFWKKPKYVYNVPVFQHTGDTDHGSSGSPCFDDSWNLVGTHHAAIQITEEGRHPMRKTFIANEGVKIDAIIKSWEQGKQSANYDPEKHGELFGGNLETLVLDEPSEIL